MTPSSALALRGARARLLRWYRRERRDLPWRRTRDPYAIWVSEVMLQQTRVAVVIPYYERFLARFPSVRALARASEDEVLSLWSGLGYYRRARALRDGARAIVREHDGTIPSDVEQLQALPGIGRYTAGAIASLAFGRQEPVLDGNVRRVLARLLAIRRPSESALWEVARILVRGASPSDWNQALMELGALVCTSESPHCERCPLARDCAGFTSGKPESFPAPRPRARSERVRVAVALVRAGDRVLLERPGPESPLRGTWDLPAVTIAAEEDARGAIERRFARERSLTLRIGAREASVSHAILSRRLAIDAYACALSRGKPDGVALRWCRLEGLPDTPVSGATKKLLRQDLADLDSSHVASISSTTYAGKRGRGSASSARSKR